MGKKTGWDKVEEDIERGPLGLAKVVLFALLIGLVIFGVIHYIVKPFSVVEKVTNPDKIIYNYEYFYNQAEAYRAIKVKIATANKSVDRFKEEAGPRKQWTYEDKTEYSRLVNIADGLVYQCNDIVAQYNAKTEQVTRSIFKTDDTPYRLQECN